VTCFDVHLRDQQQILWRLTSQKWFSSKSGFLVLLHQVILYTEDSLPRCLPGTVCWVVPWWRVTAVSVHTGSCISQSSGRLCSCSPASICSRWSSWSRSTRQTRSKTVTTFYLFYHFRGYILQFQLQGYSMRYIKKIPVVKYWLDESPKRLNIK